MPQLQLNIEIRKELQQVLENAFPEDVVFHGIPADIISNLSARNIDDLTIEQNVAEAVGSTKKDAVDDLLHHITEVDHYFDRRKTKIIVEGELIDLRDVVRAAPKELLVYGLNGLYTIAMALGYDGGRLKPVMFEQELEQYISDTNKLAKKDDALIPGLGALGGDVSNINVDHVYGQFPELAQFIKTLSISGSFGRSYVVRKVRRNANTVFWNIFPTKYYGENPHKALRVTAVTITPEVGEPFQQYSVSVM